MARSAVYLSKSAMKIWKIASNIMKRVDEEKCKTFWASYSNNEVLKHFKTFQAIAWNESVCQKV